MSTITDIFTNLVQIDSPSGHEAKLADYLTAWLKPLGFTCRTDAVGNLLAAKAGRGQPVLLCAHMDTVQPGAGIKPVIQDGVIKSSGTTILGADNKAALASILAAVSQHSNELSALELLFTVKEETGGGVEFFPFEWLQSKYGFIFDHAAPLGKIVVAAPFIINFTAEFIGKAAHAKAPQLGQSAIVPAAIFISQFAKTKLGPNTLVNFGQLTAGTGANVVPEQALVLSEVRSSSKSSFQTTLAKLELLAQTISAKYGVELDWQTSGYCIGYAVGPDSIAKSQATKVLKQQGYLAETVISQGVSDANVLREKGFDVVVLSDGVQNPHSVSECMTVADLEKLGQIVATLLIGPTRPLTAH